MGRGQGTPFFGRVGAIIALTASFAFRFFFVTPEKIYGRLQKQLENAESKLRKQNPANPPEVEDLDGGYETQKARTPITTLILICLVTSFGLVATVQRIQILMLKTPAQENSKSEKQTASTPKPIPKLLPTKVVPRPEQPPSPPPPASTQQLATIETPTIATQMPVEVFNADTSFIGTAMTKIDKIKADIEAKKAKETADTEAQAKAEKEKLRLEIPRDWERGLNHYRRMLVVLHDTLLDEAKKNGDGIVQSEGYFQCIPSAIDPQIGEIKAATIGLQNNTNVSFSISISGLNYAGHRQVYVSCAAGNLEIYPGMGDDFYAILNADLGVPFDNKTTADKADGLISDYLDSLIVAQYQFLSKTRKQ